ncbi:metal transporter [Janibacter sp. Soil728]|uniref:ion channel n=1 Tax=Janibacter sp. Soil728 TaxID=1736393 RepID=UPI0006F3D155|nr:ion channel [Janibacter sp. Soil728]KRE37877.1 metal transporter [Janibacter sp. Soil728]
MTKAWYELDSRPTGTRYWAAVIRKQPSAILVSIQLLAILLLPWVESEYWGRAVITSLSLVAVTFGIWVVRSTPGLTWLALLIGLPAFIFEVWSVIDESNVAVAFLAYFLLAIFYMYVAYGLVAYMFADSWVTKDEMFAVGAAFTVLLFAFAYLYGAIQTLAPGSFVGFAPGEHRSFLELLSFSAANLAGVGLSDIAAVEPQARAAVILEQLGGALYVAMVISRLVAMAVMRSRN